MTNEERDLIANFMARVGGAPQSSGFLASSVPSTQPAMPPIDREADQFIGHQMQMYPEAKYRITQTAIVQEAALAEAQNRIQRLQWELQQTQQAMQQQQQQGGQQSGQSRGFFGGLFGGSQPQQPPPRPGQGNPWGQAAQPAYGGYQPSSPPPQPQYPPNYQPGMFQRGGGSGFLGSALTTAAGVAGGMVVGNALMNAFSGSHGAAGASTASWGSNASSPGSLFDGSGVDPTDPTAGFASNAGSSDTFASGGDTKTDAGFDTQTSWDSGGGGFDSGAGGFDGGGGGGFDDNT